MKASWSPDGTDYFDIPIHSYCTSVISPAETIDFDKIIAVLNEAPSARAIRKVHAPAPFAPPTPIVVGSAHRLIDIEDEA